MDNVPVANTSTTDWNFSLGPSIKYVTLFLMIFDPPTPVTNCHKS